MSRPPLPQVVVRAVPMGGGGGWPGVLLGHGEHPAAAGVRAVRAAGGPPVEVVRPLAVRLVGDEIEIELEVRASAPPTDPVEPVAARSNTLQHRRIAAYAVVLDAGRVLLTQLSHDTPAPGTWTLPGGGIDPGEAPKDAVVREVLEETAHDLLDAQLLDVDSTHFTGRSPAGRLEDYHGISIVYRADVRDVFEPQVLDVGGSTAAAAWVPVDELAGLAMSPRSRARLARVLSLAQA